MEKSRKFMNLIALSVFLVSNILTPLSYVGAEEQESLQENVNSETQLGTDDSLGGGTLLLI